MKENVDEYKNGKCEKSRSKRGDKTAKDDEFAELASISWHLQRTFGFRDSFQRQRSFNHTEHAMLPSFPIESNQRSSSQIESLSTVKTD